MNENTLIPGEEYICKVCGHYKPKSLFCRKGILQEERMFCREFNSYKVKVYVRQWDPIKKKILMFSRCLNYRGTLKLKSKATISSIGDPALSNIFYGKNT